MKNRALQAVPISPSPFRPSPFRPILSIFNLSCGSILRATLALNQEESTAIHPGKVTAMNWGELLRDF